MVGKNIKILSHKIELKLKMISKKIATKYSKTQSMEKTVENDRNRINILTLRKVEGDKMIMWQCKVSFNGIQ